MITGDQIRAARALLKMSADELADRAGVGVATVRRFESAAGVPAGQVRVLDSLKITLEQAGIEFIGAPDDGPGVRIFQPASRDKSS